MIITYSIITIGAYDGGDDNDDKMKEKDVETTAMIITIALEIWW